MRRFSNKNKSTAKETKEEEANWAIYLLTANNFINRRVLRFNMDEKYAGTTKFNYNFKDYNIEINLTDDMGNLMNLSSAPLFGRFVIGRKLEIIKPDISTEDQFESGPLKGFYRCQVDGKGKPTYAIINEKGEKIQNLTPKQDEPFFSCVLKIVNEETIRNCDKRIERVTEDMLKHDKDVIVQRSKSDTNIFNMYDTIVQPYLDYIETLKKLIALNRKKSDIKELSQTIDVDDMYNTLETAEQNINGEK